LDSSKTDIIYGKKIMNRSQLSETMKPKVRVLFWK